MMMMSHAWSQVPHCPTFITVTRGKCPAAATLLILCAKIRWSGNQPLVMSRREPIPPGYLFQNGDVTPRQVFA